MLPLVLNFPKLLPTSCSAQISQPLKRPAHALWATIFMFSIVLLLGQHGAGSSRVLKYDYWMIIQKHFKKDSPKLNETFTAGNAF